MNIKTTVTYCYPQSESLAQKITDSVSISESEVELELSHQLYKFIQFILQKPW